MNSATVLKAKKIESVFLLIVKCENFDAFDKLLSIYIVDHEIFEKKKVLDVKSLLEKYQAILRKGFQQAYRSD